MPEKQSHLELRNHFIERAQIRLSDILEWSEEWKRKEAAGEEHDPARTLDVFIKEAHGLRVDFDRARIHDDEHKKDLERAADRAELESTPEEFIDPALRPQTPTEKTADVLPMTEEQKAKKTVAKKAVKKTTKKSE